MTADGREPQARVGRRVILDMKHLSCWGPACPIVNLLPFPPHVHPRRGCPNPYPQLGTSFIDEMSAPTTQNIMAHPQEREKSPFSCRRSVPGNGEPVGEGTPSVIGLGQAAIARALPLGTLPACALAWRHTLRFRRAASPTETFVAIGPGRRRQGP